VTITTRLNTTGLAALLLSIPKMAKQDTDAAAAQLQELAASLAPKATGSLAASIYVTNGETSDYSQRVGDAQSLNPGVQIGEEIMPEFVLSNFSSSADMANSYVDVVGVAAGHGIFQEFGTRYQAPQAFLTPACEIIRSSFAESFANVADF